MSRSECDPVGISRRVVMRSAAWSVPVIALAVAAPAAAASTTTNVSIHYDTVTLSRRLDLNGDQIGLFGVVAVGSDPGSGTWSNLLVIIDLPSPAVDGSAPTVTGDGWILLNVQPQPGGFTYVFSYPGALSAGSSTTTLIAVFPGTPNPFVAVTGTFRTTATGSIDELVEFPGA